MFYEERRLEPAVPALGSINSLSELWRILDEMERTMDELMQILEGKRTLEEKLASSEETHEDIIKAAAQEN